MMPSMKNIINTDVLVEFQRIVATKLCISTKVRCISCEKDDVKVELALCDVGTETEKLQRVYINKVRQKDRKWYMYFNNLWQQIFHKDSKSMHAVYLIMIKHDRKLPLNNDVVENCIQKCLKNLINELTLPVSEKYLGVGSASTTAKSEEEKLTESRSGDVLVSEESTVTPPNKNVINTDVLAEFSKTVATKLNVSTKVNIVNCEKDGVKVELALCDVGIETARLQRVYINKKLQKDCQWYMYFNNLWQQTFHKGSKSTHGVYLIMITHDRTLPVNNDVVANCIQRCVKHVNNELPS